MLFVVPADEQLQKRQTLALAEPAGDAVVEQGDAAVALDEEVAAVQVAVEDPVQQGALQERDHLRSQHGRRVDPGRPHALDVVPGEAVEPLHDEHPARHEPWMGAGDDDGALVGLCEDVADVEHVGGLEAEVELLDDRLGEKLDERRRVGERRHRDPPDEEGGEEAHARRGLVARARRRRVAAP